eukprot:TRINITY_DN70394_c0_g1_i1.p1 TRINITY_DN70394_c0_g1~~TRINITY_DN70394_c0_g1_i1.p1  ORF type:complete len:257 (+),score=46.89 TRINITY_DN70394_c0_g1_i1:88-858(+)
MDSPTTASAHAPPAVQQLTVGILSSPHSSGGCRRQSPGGGFLAPPSPSFGLACAEPDDGSVHTNSTGDDGAAERAASCILDLEAIKRSGTSPCSPLVEVAMNLPGDDAPGTGQATPETGDEMDESQQQAATEERLTAAASSLRRGSQSMARHASMRRHGTNLSRRVPCSPTNRTSPRRVASYRRQGSNVQAVAVRRGSKGGGPATATGAAAAPDGLPTDCRKSPVALGSGVRPLDSPSQSPRKASSSGTGSDASGK